MVNILTPIQTEFPPKSSNLTVHTKLFIKIE
jgi:hypothetical protein